MLLLLLIVGLSQEQTDKLWECLATNPESCEDCLSWFYDQARGKENHALDLDTMKHIFINKVSAILRAARECSVVFVVLLV